MREMCVRGSLVLTMFRDMCRLREPEAGIFSASGGHTQHSSFRKHRCNLFVFLFYIYRYNGDPCTDGNGLYLFFVSFFFCRAPVFPFFFCLGFGHLCALRVLVGVTLR
jgi:hypothetical protein